MDNDRIWNLIAKKLAGEASPGELKELESALRLNPDLHYSLEALQDMWKKQSEDESAQSEIAFQRHMDRMRSLGMDMGISRTEVPQDEFPDSPNRFQKRKMIAFLSAGFILLFLGYYFLNIRNTSSAVPQKPVWEVITRNGSKSNIQLPDGSSVWLNAGSRLTYDSLYGTALREVTLSGEAYFDVVKNPKKPFIIHTGKINIRVLGTIFNVRSYPEDRTIETSLIKGSIEVSFPAQPSKKIILKPNQKLIIDKTDSNPGGSTNRAVTDLDPLISIQHLNRIGSDSSITETGWMENRLYFDDMSFHDLLQNMERKYGVSFKMSDAALDTIHFTGSFQNETVSQALDALRLTAEQSTADFTYEIKGNQVFIYNNTSDAPSTQPK
ncbi:MAG TPA: FecR family protein [Puia sp.]|nr:FecR family protein [Puia sp.]